MIVERLIDYVHDSADLRKVEDIRVGLGYSAVLLDDGSSGAAFVFRNELGPRNGLIDEAGEIAGTSSGKLLDWAMDTNLVKASIGIACINALLQKNLHRFDISNAVEKIDVRADDVVGMIGYYRPLLDKNKIPYKDIYIFERKISDSDNLYPDWSEDIYLPRCDVVIITGTTFINKTIDHILEKCTNAREVVVMGPSTPLCPEVLGDYNINMIAGIKVQDSKRLLRTASEAGGGLSLESAVQKIYKRIK